MSYKDILVSVIIPVYNVEAYLSECVNSVLNQTYRNIEVILVDDGSPDNCPQMCDEFALKDSRVKVVHKDNGGPSSAREAGIVASSGDYVMLIDGDDWIDIETVEHCVAEVQNHNLDCVIFSYCKERGGSRDIRHLFEEDKCYLNKEEFDKNIYIRLFGLTNDMLSHPESLDYLTSCCMKLYRKELLKNIEYVDIKRVGSGEDGIFGIYALKNCSSAIYIDKPFYHYRSNENSATSTFRPDLVSQWSVLFKIMQQFLYDNDLPGMYQEALNNRIALGVLGIGLNGLCDNKMKFSEFKSYMNSFIKSDMYISAVKTTDLCRLPITWRCLLFCSKNRMTFSVCIGLKLIKYLKSRI